MRAVAEEVRDLVVEYGGANSSEHGDGLARSEFNRRLFGDELYDAMCEVKRDLRPRQRDEPGEDRPRAGDDRAPAGRGAAAGSAARTTLSFAATGGMRGAADRCMNIGRLPQGVDGRDVPLVHGDSRGGALHPRPGERAGGTLSPAGPAERARRRPAAPGARPLPGVQGVQERVPSGRRHGVPEKRVSLPLPGPARRALRRRLFAAVRRAQPSGVGRGTAVECAAPAPRCARALSSAGWASAAAVRCRASSGRACCAGRRSRTMPTRGSRGQVVFLADSFTTYTEPGVGRAAIELLEQAGHEVVLLSAGCCGRAAISKGLLGDARRHAAAMTDLLHPYASRGVPIVGVEPSCILTLTEEHLSLQPGNDRAATVAAQVRLVEELIADAVEAGALVLDGHGHGPPHPLPRPLSPEGTGRDGAERPSALADPGGNGGRARRRLLRDGGILRLRGRALRPLDAGGWPAAVPRGQRGAARHPGRGHRGVLPPADRARHPAARTPPVELVREVVREPLRA